MKIEEEKREALKNELGKLHTFLTDLSQSYYDPEKERVKIEYPTNSEGRQLEQVYNEIFSHLLKVKKELDYYALPILDTGILKYDEEKERFVFKSVRENIVLSAGMDLEILVEDYFTETKQWVRTRLEYLPQAIGGVHLNGWYITEDKELELEGALARIRKKTIE
ncbi:hypothetical protein A5844_001391 [Enterococcus sp. 10A9_DIV0425]|uniref:DUF5348 domain-containing protein n=1 Tax=Candidatus Enterococcus wittei TaxID=1987383 RepID=A0A242K0R9_9ENTE|nr:DUF5348 domain-containing protein [Enterococcus sp. 10A9_DIV0425]OTP11257.1 hypothetical protein A5844_001391 [Enterococcus sp. 10A9_DIV0425]THE15811.1 hypothetical protein E1H99_02280 [Enterococcus hirae]